MYIVNTRKISLICLLSVAIIMSVISSCSSPKDIVFANREWRVSDYYGQIIDKDTTYRMTFGDVLIPDPLTIVSSADSVALYPGMYGFLADILHTAHLDSAEILFYAPEMQTMFVRPKNMMPPIRPNSISTPMSDEQPYTMWVNDGDVENWNREASEMYTYTYFDKRKKQLLIVDLYDYGDIPIAQITIFQSKTKATSKFAVRETIRRSFYEIHDLKYYTRDIEFWSNNVEARRARAFANYKIGQEQKHSKACLCKADSLLTEYKYSDALNQYFAAYSGNIGRMNSTVAMNAAIAAAQCDKDSLALELVSHALNADSTFFDERISVTEQLEDCRILPQWDSFQNENERRLARVMTSYDIPLRNTLLGLYHTDQDTRGHLMAMVRANPQNKQAIDSCWREILHIDSINLSRTIELLDEYGWIPRSKVGTANEALFFVIQHASPEIIDKYITLFETAAKKNEIPKDLYAKMYDRNEMYSGRPQRYGTQRVKYPDSKESVLWRLEDPENVNSLRKEMGLAPLDSNLIEGAIK